MAASVAFHRSLLGRSMLLGVLPASLVVLLIVVINGLRAWSEIATTLEGDLNAAVELAAGEIDAANKRSLAQAQLMALAQESGMFGRRAETLMFIEKVLRANPELHAA